MVDESLDKEDSSMGGARNYLSFILTLVSILGSFSLAWYKDVSIEMLLPSLLGIYVLGRTSQKGMAYFAASKDGKADTRAVIQDLNGITPTDEKRLKPSTAISPDN